MNRKSSMRRSRSWTFIFQVFAFMFLMQLLLITNPLNPNNLTSVSASPLTSIDNIWEIPPGPGAPNDVPSNAWDLTSSGSHSITNDPTTPLNVTTFSPDYYNFTVYPYFYFSVSIEFNQTNVYNATDSNGSILILDDPPFVADIDIELLAANGTVLGTSKGNSNKEAIGPIDIGNHTEVYTINVSAVKPELGYDYIDYSTTYNMSIVFDDKWEFLQSNDNFEDIDDPTDGSCDDEITPGNYSNLRFSEDINTEYRNKDWYVIWFFNNTKVNITISGYTDYNLTHSNPTQRGPDLWIYDEDSNATTQNVLTYYEDGGDASPYTEFLAFPTNYTGWYYIRVYNSLGTANHYTMVIETEDSYEFDVTVSNNINSTAMKMVAGEYPGMVVSEGKDDWYVVEVQEKERIMVDINWFSILPKFDINLSLYQNSSADSLVSSGDPIFKGLRAGPDRADKYTWYYIHVSGDNVDPRYYNLTIVVEDLDDWAEDNDLILNPYILPAKSQVFEPTEADPWAGLFSLKNDQDWFAMSLIPGDFLTVRIEFNGSEGDLDMGLFDGGWNLLDASVQSPSNEETVFLRVVHPDIYLFTIYGKPGSYATAGLDYNMTITVQEFDDSFESNDDSNTAAPIAEGNFTDLILRDGDDDWFYLYLHETDVIEISLTFFAGSYEVSGETYLNDIDLDLLNDDESLANQSRTLFNESLTFKALVSGKYFVVCVIDGSSNAYNLTINITETDDIYEDNDILEDSQWLDVEIDYNATVLSVENNLWIRVKDDDFYHVNIPAGLAIIVELNFASSENLDLELLSSNGTILDSSLLTTGNAEEVGPYPMNATYISLYNVSDIYFRVFMDSGLIAQYSMTITVGPEEVLITRETVPPFTSGTSTTKAKPVDWGPIILLGGGGAILGGGGAAGFYGAKKAGLIGKGSKGLRGRFGKGGTGGTGGTGGKIGKIGKGGTGGVEKIRKPP